MRRKNYLSLIFWGLLLVALLASCNDEESLTTEETQVSFSVERDAAQAWYEAQSGMRKSVRTRASIKEKTLSTIDMEPIWQESFRRKNKNHQAVEALMEASMQKNFLIPGNYEKYKATGNPRYKQSLTRLVVLTDRHTNETTGFTMTIQPTVEYMEKTGFKAFKSSYLVREKDFSGYIMFHSLDGSTRMAGSRIPLVSTSTSLNIRKKLLLRAPWYIDVQPSLNMFW